MKINNKSFTPYNTIRVFIPYNTIRGFTLIELLIVLALIAILATILIVTIKPNEIFKKARDSQRIANLKQIDQVFNAISIADPTFYELNYFSTNTIYLSLKMTSATTNCAIDYPNLPPLPSNWSYRCSQTPTAIDGTGWIPLNFNNYPILNLSQLPIDPINKPPYYYSFVAGGSYELNAFFESDAYQSTALKDNGDSDNGFEIGTNLYLMPLTFPHNWIKVPGNPLYGTSDFWVMKYEAKYSKTGSGKGYDAGNCYFTSGIDTWDWGKTSTDCPSSWSATNVISSPYGSPIAGVTHNEAKTICQALGGHLITNQEWMTIARNAEQVPKNWSGGSVGSGCLFVGNTGVNYSCGYDGANPEKGTGRNTKARLILSNGQEIWDLSGNVWEHVMKDINDTLVNNLPTDGGAAGWRWMEHTAIIGYGDLSYDEIRPSNSSWNSTQGMGTVLTYNGFYANRVLLRGGRWTLNAGVFALDLSWGTGDQYEHVGFRCAR